MGAEFTINDTAFDTLGHDASNSQVLDLELEDSTGLDAPRVVYSVVASSDGAPALTFNPSTGIPTTPTGTVTVTMPASGVHSYRIQCQINEGRDSTGRTNREYTKERIVAIRSENLELRKLVPGETTQYSSTGWTEEQNAAVDAIDAVGGDSGTTEDVDATADTLLLRGAAGEGRVTRIETPIVRTSSGGDVTLQEGSTTYARFRSTTAAAQVGDVRFNATSGHPYVYLVGPGETAVFIDRVRWPKASPDTLATDAVDEIPILASPGYPWTIASARFIPRAGLTANATNYARLQVHIRNAGGFLSGSAAIGNTIPSGANATDSWVEFQPVSLTLQSGLLAFPFVEDDSASFSIEKLGLGVSVPAGLLEVVIVPWQEP